MRLYEYEWRKQRIKLLLWLLIAMACVIAFSSMKTAFYRWGSVQSAAQAHPLYLIYGGPFTEEKSRAIEQDHQQMSLVDKLYEEGLPSNEEINAVLSMIQENPLRHTGLREALLLAQKNQRTIRKEPGILADHMGADMNFVESYYRDYETVRQLRSQWAMAIQLAQKQSEYQSIMESNSSHTTYRSMLAASMYSALIAPDEVKDTLVWRQIFENYFEQYGEENYLILVFMVLWAAFLFYDEYRGGMSLLLRSAARGGGHIVASKIGLVATGGFVATVVYAVTTLFTYAYYFPWLMDSWNSPIQTIYGLSLAPFPLSCGGAFLVLAGMKFIAALTVGLLVLCVASFTKQVILPIAAGALAIGVPLLIDMMTSTLTAPYKLIYTPTGMMNNGLLFLRTFWTENWFGFPVLGIHSVLIVHIGLIVLCCGGIYWGYAKRAH